MTATVEPTSNVGIAGTFFQANKNKTATGNNVIGKNPESLM